MAKNYVTLKIERWEYGYICDALESMREDYEERGIWGCSSDDDGIYLECAKEIKEVYDKVYAQGHKESK